MRLAQSPDTKLRDGNATVVVLNHLLGGICVSVNDNENIEAGARVTLILSQDEELGLGWMRYHKRDYKRYKSYILSFDCYLFLVS